MSLDCRGVSRGYCNQQGCSCFGYDGTASSGGRCTCGHPPARHAKVSMMSVGTTKSPSPPPSAMNSTEDDDIQSVDSESVDSESDDEAPTASIPFVTKLIFGSQPRRSSAPTERKSPPKPAPRSLLRSLPASRHAWGAPAPPPSSLPRFSQAPLPTCNHPNCHKTPFFDLNTGENSDFCSHHMSTGHPLPTAMDDDTLPSMMDGISMQSLPSHGTIAFDSPSFLPRTTPLDQSSMAVSPPSQLHTHFSPPFFTPSQSMPNFQTVQQPHHQIPPPHPLGPLLLPDDQRCMYPMCNKPRFRETNGKVHECCGITHAREYTKLKGETIEPGLKCKTAGCIRQKRRREDGNGYYNYCGRSCRDGTFRTTPAVAGETCIFPNCTKPRYVDPANGRVHDYCGRTHANQAQATGLAPQVCTIKVLSAAEMTQIESHFKSQWSTKKGACPALTCVFQITNQQLEARWNAYGKNLPSNCKTVEKYYHGTKLKCDIVQTGSPCTDKDCGVCGISKFGMFRECIRKNINFQRFGHGFYFAPNSSKCHDYTQGVATHRAMLLVDIYPGKKHVILTDDVKLTKPPDGCHSVCGQPGRALNYAEIVVYNPDCVMPRYIVVYVLNGVHKIAK